MKTLKMTDGDKVGYGLASFIRMGGVDVIDKDGATVIMQEFCGMPIFSLQQRPNVSIDVDEVDVLFAMSRDECIAQLMAYGPDDLEDLTRQFEMLKRFKQEKG